MIRILGFDPGMTNLGFGAVREEDEQLFLVSYGLISNPRNPDQSFNAYINSGIAQITADLPRLLDITKPDLICSELVPPGRLGSNTELVVAAITTCKVIANQFGIEWKDIAANTVKKEVTGNDKATKTVVRNAVIAQFPQMGDRHKEIKADEKLAGLKPIGLLQDVFDGVAVAMAGINKFG